MQEATMKSKASNKQLLGVIMFILVLLANTIGAKAQQKASIALVGGAGWNTIAVAFSNGNGTFNVTNDAVTLFPTSVATPGVTVVTGDFNGDGMTDVALVGGAGWKTIPVAFSNGDGTFNVTNDTVTTLFPTSAATPGVKVVTGDFNGDGKADIALVGGAGWKTIPVAFSNGNGTFNVTNDTVTTLFPISAATPGVKVVTGDFNGDGKPISRWLAALVGRPSR